MIDGNVRTFLKAELKRTEERLTYLRAQAKTLDDELFQMRSEIQAREEIAASFEAALGQPVPA